MKYDVVFLWKQNDSAIYGRRADMIIKELRQHKKINNIVHFDAPISIGSLNEYKAKAQLSNHNSMIYENTINAYQGNKQIYGVKSYTYIYSRRIQERNDYPTMAFHFDYVKRILDENNIGKKNKVLLWGCPIIKDWEKWLNFLKPDFIVSDIIDDNREYASYEKIKKRLTGEYQAVIGKSDLLLVNSENMYKRILDINPNAKKKLCLVSNGCEGYFGKVFEKPALLKQLIGPVIGMVSTLEKKIDTELLLECVKKHPEWNFIIIGSDHTSEKALKDLNTYDNVRFLGPVPYEEVKNYIANFDVAIMPHRLISLNIPMNPLKLYVYCGLGVKVVTTDIPGIEDLKEIVYTAGSDSEFISLIEHVVNEGSRFSKNEIKIINRHTWENKVKAVFKYISRKSFKAKFRKDRIKIKLFRFPLIRPLHLKWVTLNERIRNNEEEILYLRELLKKAERELKKQINPLSHIDDLRVRVNQLNIKVESFDSRLHISDDKLFAVQPLVSIVITNDNNIKLIRGLLNSIEKNSIYENYEIILVNRFAETNRSIYDDIYSGNKPFKVVICKETNYAEALNYAAGYANGSYIVFFRFALHVSKGWLLRLMEAQLNFGNIGASGGTLVKAEKSADRVYFHGSLRKNGNRGEMLYEIKPYTAVATYQEIMEDHDFNIHGCLTDEGILLSLSKFRKAGGADTCYINGYEGMDLSLELHRRGYQNIVCRSVKIYIENRPDINNEHNFMVFKCKWQSYLDRQILTDKINNLNHFTKSRLLVGIIGHAKDDLAPVGFDDFIFQLKQTDYRIKYIPCSPEGDVNVGIDADILIFSGKDSSNFNLLNTKNGLFKISWAEINSRWPQCSELTIKAFKEWILKQNRHQVIKGTIDILGCMPLNDNKYIWGDYHYALSLKKEFEKRGFTAYIKCYQEWFERSDSEYVLVLRGIFSYYPKAERQKVIFWHISHPQNVNVNEYNASDIVYIASLKEPEAADKLRVPYKVLLQCADVKMAKVVSGEKTDDLIFVGNSKTMVREIVNYSVRTEWELSVYGRYWENILPARHIKSEYLDNDEVGQAYHNAKIVLNDHAEDMLKFGFINNRIFDALMAKSFIISDYMPEITGLFGDCVEMYTSEDEFRHKVDYFMKHPALRDDKAKRGQEIVLREHTFGNRVETIISDMEQIN